MNKLATLLCLNALFFSSGLLAAGSDEEIQALREQIRILAQRLDALEQKNAAASESTEATETSEMSVNQAPILAEQTMQTKIDDAVAKEVAERKAASSWTERMRWKGDFRYRYESLDNEDAENRNRNRIRARAQLEADLSPTISVGLGLATGGDDPVSSTQTLGGGGSSKDVKLDLAYFEWTGLGNTHVLGGKMKNYLETPGLSQLMWDIDWRPEGVGAYWENERFFAKGLGTWLEGDSRRGTEFAWIAQAGMKLDLAEDVMLRFGAAYAQFDIAGARPVFGDADNFQGNSFDPETLTYLYDYHVIEAFAELRFRLGDKPSIFFADYVHNTEAEENNQGYLVGFTYGAAKQAGTWEMNYGYQRLEADAVVGLLSNSNFGGGGTDAKGSILSGAYALHDKWLFRLTYFLNEVDLSAGDPRDANRVQLDLNFQYD